MDALNEVAKLSVKVSKLIVNEGVRVAQDEEQIVKEVMKNQLNTFDENTPMRLLWQQQYEQSQKSPKGMRWHPLIIRWCLSIYQSSPATYRHIASKRNNFLVLPHVNTLKKYINFTDPMTGFNPDIIKQLIKDSKLEILEEYQKNVSLLFDEMKIQSNLVYKKSTGKIVGFVEMGDINEEISQFQTKFEDSECQGEESIGKKVTKYVNVFTVRGILSKLCYPTGYHASTGFTGDQLFQLVWEATRILQTIGFKVRVWVCDGATPNRKCFKINATDDDNNYYNTVNQFAPERQIYFISDVPHLLKTTRNNLENSHGNKNSRNLHVST